MKKITLLTSAIIIAACSSAHAVEAPSLGDQIKANWDQKVDRSNFMAPVKPGSDFLPNASTNSMPSNDGMIHNDNGMMHHHMKHNMTPDQRAAKKAEWDKMTPEQKAAMKAKHQQKMANMTPEQKAKMKADRKAKWDAMTPAQKAAWKAKHDAKKAAVTTSTPAAAGTAQ